VRRELLTTYQKLCQAAGLKLAALTPRPFGLAAAAAAPMVPADMPAALIAAGEGWAEFCVVRSGTLLLARSLTPGSGLAGEVRRNLSLFAGQQPGQHVDAVYVAGADNSPLKRRLSDALELPVHAFDPFGGASGDMLPADERGSFAGAAGILLAKVKPQGLPVNFVRPRQPAPPKRVSVRVVAGIAAAVLLLLGGGIALGRSVVDKKNGIRDERLDTSESLDNRLIKAKETLKHIQPLDAWEGPVWLDELYDLAAHIRDVDALRVTQWTANPLPRTNKSRYTSSVRIRGTFRDDRAPLDQLVAELRKDSHYGPSPPVITSGNQFELTVDVERRSPDEYKRLQMAGGPGQ
jgi:hypothetical protein